MRSVILCLFLATGMALCAADTQTGRWTVPVAVENAGFEDGAEGWTMPGNAAVVEEGAYEGTRCLRLTVQDPMTEEVYVTRRVPVVGGSFYLAECFVKTEGVVRRPGRMTSCGAGLIVEWADHDGKWFAAGQYAANLFGDHDWTRRVCEGLRAPEEAGFAVIFLALRGAGTAWFDDVKLMRVHQALVLEAPEPDAEIADNTPTFRWRDDPRAADFVLKLSPDRTFPVDATLEFPAQDHVLTLPEPIEPGTWFWTVSAPGYDQGAVWSLRQTAPVNADTTAPVIVNTAARVTEPDQAAVFHVREESATAPQVTATLDDFELNVELGPRDDNVWPVRVFCPGGWVLGRTRVVLVAVDAAGNRCQEPVSVINRPVPEQPVRIDGDGGYSRGGERFFPFGIYQVEPQDMARVKAGGFDVVHMYTWEGNQDDTAARAYLDAAWEHGLRVFIGFDRGNHSGKGIVQGNTDHIMARVSALCDHPALFCWYLFDEPELAHQYVSARALITYAELIRQLDPFHPVVVTTWGARMNRYRRSWDTHWTQAYHEPDKVVATIRSHRELLDNDSPITLLVHCYDRRQSEAHAAGKEVDPAMFQPDADWMRAAAYAGITQQVNGLWWWWYAVRNNRFYNAARLPWAWGALTRVVGELKLLEPVLIADEPVASVTIETDHGRIETWAKTVNGITTLIAVNTSETHFEAAVPAPGDGPVDVLFEGRHVERNAGAITDHFGRYDVHVYRFAE